MLKFFSLLLLGLIVNSCDKNKIVHIAPMLADCQGVGKQKCLQIKEQPEDEWTLFYDQIEGFDYQEGFNYTIEVAIAKVESPTADASSLKYTLTKLIKKEAIKEKNSLSPSLLGNWEVIKITGIDSLEKKPTLNFKEGQISGNAGCNRYNSSYTADGNSISIGLAMATKMYCTYMNIEKAFFDCLQKAKTYSITTNKLVIYSNEGKELLICNLNDE